MRSDNQEIKRVRLSTLFSDWLTISRPTPERHKILQRSWWGQNGHSGERRRPAAPIYVGKGCGTGGEGKQDRRRRIRLKVLSPSRVTSQRLEPQVSISAYNVKAAVF
ncbi:hypothetical protein AOLI_G00101380 [Acnodon oligacanthus]